MPLGSVGGQFPNKRLVDADQYILRFDVGVYDPALGVQIIQTFQNLSTTITSHELRRRTGRYVIDDAHHPSNVCLYESGTTNLADDGLDVEQGNALVLAADDELKEVVAEDLKDHADVRPVDAADLKVVEELDSLLAFGVRFVAFADAAQ